MTREAVTSDQLPASGLPFSVAVRGGGLLFLSGQVAQDPATGELVDGDVAQQADQILRNIAATLAAIGKDLDDVIRVGVFLTDMSQFGHSGIVCLAGAAERSHSLPFAPSSPALPCPYRAFNRYRRGLSAVTRAAQPLRLRHNQSQRSFGRWSEDELLCRRCGDGREGP